VITAVALYARTIELDLTQFLRKQIDLRTSYASSQADYHRAFELLRNGDVESNILLSFYNLTGAEQGFADSEKLKVMKAIVNCQS
jgi:threonine dehydrogenase-like Zn-dependent dehydrogenase